MTNNVPKKCTKSKKKKKSLLNCLPGVADEPGLALPARVSGGVVLALDAHVELVEAGAGGVHVALAGGVAGVADKGEMAAAHVGCHAVPVEATRLAHGSAFFLAAR